MAEAGRLVTGRKSRARGQAKEDEFNGAVVVSVGEKLVPESILALSYFQFCFNFNALHLQRSALLWNY